jgi:hypothetical protein
MFKVKTTLMVTTEELEVFCDPPLTFEAVGNIDPNLWSQLKEWSERDYPPGEAVNFVPRLFFSVSQNGKAYPLTTQAEAEELRQAVGDAFLCDLVENYWTYEYSYFKKKRLASASLLAEHATGNGSEPQP